LILPSSLRKKRWGIEGGEKVKFGGEKKLIHSTQALPARGGPWSCSLQLEGLVTCLADPPRSCRSPTPAFPVPMSDCNTRFTSALWIGLHAALGATPVFWQTSARHTATRSSTRHGYNFNQLLES
jgi:hypothetical protein